MSRRNPAARLEEIRVRFRALPFGGHEAVDAFVCNLLPDVEFLLNRCDEVEATNYALDGELGDVRRDLAEQLVVNRRLESLLERRTLELARALAKLARTERNYDAQSSMLRMEVA